MIDFSALFAAWLKTRQMDMTRPQEEIEEQALDLYGQWLNTPLAALDNRAPAHYFDEFSPDALVSALLDYAGLPGSVPDPLCDAINRCADCAVLLIAALDKPLTPAQNLAVLERLGELKDERMMVLCIKQVTGSDTAKAEQAAQFLQVFGESSAMLALQALQKGGHTHAVTDRLSDIVAGCGPCEGALEVFSNLFVKRDDAKAFYAQCLAKTGDERALPVLENALRVPLLF
jgi:hypothetical protein